MHEGKYKYALSSFREPRKKEKRKKSFLTRKEIANRVRQTLI
jgi:hypothetical protein